MLPSRLRLKTGGYAGSTRRAALPAGALDAGADGVPETAVPATFAGLVGQRLTFLSPDERRCLAAAAVLGTDPDWSLLPEVSQVDEPRVVAALRAATAVHLLVVESTRLRWRHAMTRDAVLATLLPPERAALAHRAARVLQARGGPDDAATAAELLMAAGARDAAARVLLRMAHDDLRRGALRSAAALLDRSASAGAQPTAVAIERVQLLTFSGRPREALEQGGTALDAAIGDDHAELALRLARAAVEAGAWADAEQYVERAGRPHDPRSAALADAAHGCGRVGTAAAHAATAVELAGQAGLPDAMCEALVITAKIARLGDVPMSAATFRRAGQVAAEHGLVHWRVEALLGLGTLELLRNETAPALTQARELALDAGLFAQVAQADLLLAEHVLLADGPRAAEIPARELLDQGARLRLPYAQVAGVYLTATARAWAGDAQGMEELLDRVPAESGPEAAAARSLVRASHALHAWDLRRAAGLLDSGVAQLVTHASVAPLHQFGLWVLLRAVTDDRDSVARDLLRELPVARRPAIAGALSFADAVAFGRAGQAHDAEASFASGDRTLAVLPWLRRLLRLLALEAAVADGWGDPVPALRADLADYERTGEPQLARSCRDLLRRASVPTRRGRGDAAVPPTLRAAGVTSREMDVLSLLVAHRTNAEIAAQLHLSPRTVETHVASLLAKSGAANRAELRAWYGTQTP